ncbi:MAG: helix-turn-helix domain-containing protein [Opitutaceae bacterium]|nr:helix-turn-helix domain-containing protein [Opitutaceae bacterium]
MTTIENDSEKHEMTREHADKIRSAPPLNLTKKEAAVYLRITERHLENLVSRGRIPRAKLGRRVLFLREELDRRLRMSMLAAA